MSIYLVRLTAVEWSPLISFISYLRHTNKTTGHSNNNNIDITKTKTATEMAIAATVTTLTATAIRTTATISTMQKKRISKY